MSPVPRGGGGLSARARLAATAAVLPPGIAPLLFWWPAGPGDLSFVLERSAPAASGSAWGWFGLLWAACAFLLLIFTEQGQAWLAAAGVPAIGRRRRDDSVIHESKAALLILPAVLALAWGGNAVLGLSSDFEWVEAARNGAWELKHSARGTVAAFTAENVAVIEGREEAERFRVRFAFRNGDARAMITRSPAAHLELRQLAATMELPAGTNALKSIGGEIWTNAGFNLKGCTGTYEAGNGAGVAQGAFDQDGLALGGTRFRKR